MILKSDKNKIRLNRHLRIRQNIHGTADRPRLCVFRSINHIYAQIIDDSNSITLTAASSLDKSFQGTGSNIEAAKKVGAEIAKKARDKGISQVVFDRGGYLYHGRVKALAEARANSLNF